ncbi:putative indole-3-pyruvate monooxygenase YUCCA10 [Leucoagaricus sp. SymC.cos]|nr:putative indole-3-pyruvate monooxygenase YUCCA10 [Leucoagaricus sp. SymC.cos]
MTTTERLHPKDRIPTLNRLHATLPDTVESNASLIAEAWFKSFSSFIESGNVAAVLALLCDDALWRDAYALTWDIRTLDGTAKIKPCLENRLPILSIHSFKWKEFVRFQRPYPDLAWILAMFGFETSVGECTAVVRLVPTGKENWKACTIFTNLDDLKAFPEMIGPLRQQQGVPGLVWKSQREEEVQFASSDPSVIGTFRGEILHSSMYKQAASFEGKKVVVIGSGNSGHDISADLARANIDVTMYQRSPTLVVNLDKAWKFLGGALYSEGSPPNSIADRLQHSMPHLLLEGGMSQRGTKAILNDQKDLQDGLKNAGFKLNAGILDAGILLNLKQKGGGHYFDIGATQMIIDGLIKLKNDSPILEFDESGLKFVNGSRLDADAVICATGCGDMRGFIRKLCGDVVADECPPLIGVDEEGEMTWFRPLPRKGLWYMHGSLSLTRFYSKHVAMYIKAMEQNLITSRYASELGPNCIRLR